MFKLGLIGLSIQKSSSPQLHRMLGELHDLPLSYELHEPAGSQKSDFVDTLTAIREQGYKGTNVTFPFKQLAIDLADTRNEAVNLVGSTNTLRLSEAGVEAFNTDYTGFIRGYRNRVGDQAAGSVLLIGAGGVGRAIAFALFDLGATDVTIYDLNADNARSLADAINAAGFTARAITQAELPNAAKRADGLVNCTPIGHYKTPGIPMDPALIGGQRWAFDAVYTPLDTEFLKAAGAQGLTIVSGFDLFFFQGINAFEIFTGIEVDPAAALAEYKRRFDIISDLI